ncbi:hypothetical protein CVN76_13900 [Bacillus sp. mrc49]|nr:hypothetical protein CVN76_13900 [Bacillus sp. mrc49]
MKQFKYKFSNTVGNLNESFVFTQSGMERKAARLLREMRSRRDTAGASAEAAPRPPAESERLQCNETVQVQVLKQKKTVDELLY